MFLSNFQKFIYWNDPGVPSVSFIPITKKLHVYISHVMRHNIHTQVWPARGFDLVTGQPDSYLPAQPVFYLIIEQKWCQWGNDILVRINASSMLLYYSKKKTL